MTKSTILALICAIALLCACQKSETSSDLVPVTFTYGLSGGSPFITKSGESELLFSLTPTQAITLTLIDSKGKTYSAQTGATLQIPQGTYQVTYETPTPQDSQNYGYFFFTRVPLIRINETITISKEQTQYAVTASYTSSAILYDTSEVQSASYYSKTNTERDILTSSGGGLAVFFCNGSLPEGMQLIFKGKEGYKTISIGVTTEAKEGYNLLASGNWYFLRLPTTNTSAGFSFSLLDWNEGGTLN